MNHSSIDEYFTGEEQTFIVTAQPSVPAQPPKRPLNHPAAGQYHPPFGIFRALDYL